MVEVTTVLNTNIANANVTSNLTFTDPAAPAGPALPAAPADPALPGDLRPPPRPRPHLRGRGPHPPRHRDCSHC